jgi:Helix-hairpin-helix domain
MSIPHPRALIDEDDRCRVWWRILDELEDALDVDGMPAADRGALARVHQYASWWVGVQPLKVPFEWTLAKARDDEVRRDLRGWTGEEPTAEEVERKLRWRADYDTALYADDGVGRLRVIPHAAMAGLVDAGVVTIDALAELARDERRLRAVRGIGPKTAAAIREAIERWGRVP